MKKRVCSIGLALAMLVALLPAGVQAADGGVTITQTDIPATGVANTEGYGSITQAGAEEWEAPQNGLIDSAGSYVFPYGQFPNRIRLDDGRFVGGMYADMDEYYNNSGVYSIFDLSGNQVIDKTYDYLSLHNGYGVAITNTEDTISAEDDVRELIDLSGNTLLTLPDGFNIGISFGEGPEMMAYHSWVLGYFGEIGGYGDGLLWVNTAAGIQNSIFDAAGLTEESQVVQDNLQQMAWFGGPWCGYIDLTGQVVIAPQYYGASAFSEGLASVREYVAPDVPIQDLPYGSDLGGSWKYITTTGEEAFPGRYTVAGSFSGGYAYVADENGRYSYIDKAGQMVIPAEYDSAFGAGNGQMFTVGKMDASGTVRYGMVNRDNQVVLPLEYDDISEFIDGVAYAIKDGYVHIITQGQPAKENPQTITIDGEEKSLGFYALVEENGGLTNYARLRDVAYLLNGTPAQFEVSWDGSIHLTAGTPYTVAGGELSTPFAGDRAYDISDAVTYVNGAAAPLEAITLTDDNGGGYTYYKLRDLGAALGFYVGWDAEKGVYIETDKPYSE